jgi:hypothetical protein
MEILKLDNIINKIHKLILASNNNNIVLLKYKEVIMWLFGILTFLPNQNNKKNYKIIEDKWGKKMLKLKRPNLKLNKQWTNLFGEYICEEIYILLKKSISKPIKKKNYLPDYEIENAIIEVKTQTYYTNGTAGEKILGCPFKYCEILELYLKPLKIICVGGAEKICREQYGNLDGNKCSIQKKKFIDFYKLNDIEFIGATDILKNLLICN